MAHVRGLHWQCRKAVARGLKDPSFRVIQNHFAISANLGDVAAKEEVWEVSAQLVGLSLGVLILATPGLLTSYPVLVLTWMSMRLLHLWLRYQSVSVLQFNTINLKRARILVNSHVSDSTVPGCQECNRMENILSWERYSNPRIVLGVPLDEVVCGERSGYMVKKLLKLYSKEKHILVVNQQRPKDFEVFVSLKVEVDFLMSLFERGMKDQLADMLREDIRVSVIGDRSQLPKSLQKLVRQVEEITKDYSRLHLVVAVSYSGKYDLVQACQNIALRVKDGIIEPEDINEVVIEQELETNCALFPYPDLLIRTSGELRLSNFFLWQLAYTELYFVESLWPDFGEAEFLEALHSFQQRQRRYGGRDP